MNIPFKLPLKFREDDEIIVDAEGETVLLLNWGYSGLEANEVRERGLFICNAINSLNEQENEPPKRRGNPAFVKGGTNPYKKG